MVHNDRHSVYLNTEFDIEVRIAFYRELREWSAELAANLRADDDFTPETCFLR